MILPRGALQLSGVHPLPPVGRDGARFPTFYVLRIFTAADRCEESCGVRLSQDSGERFIAKENKRELLEDSLYK
jgi:hypothetical protein